MQNQPRMIIKGSAATLAALAVAWLCTSSDAVGAGGSDRQLAAPNSGQVLVLDSTIQAGSPLLTAFTSIGEIPVVVTGATWSSMTQTQFATYDAIVLGDPSCGSIPSAVAAANAAVWAPAVTGNVIVIGTDEELHPAGATLRNAAAAFSVANTGQTGAYISLSCYYNNAPANVPVPMLSGLARSPPGAPAATTPRTWSRRRGRSRD